MGEWKRISVACRDAEPRLLSSKGRRIPIVGFWSDWNSYWTTGESDRMSDHVMISPQPTHWMKLPEPPSS